MTVFEECDEESGVQCKCVRTFFLFLDLNRYNLQFIDQFINQRNMTTCCNNTYPRDDDHLSSRGCRHSAWKKTKTFFFFLFSHCLCTRVFFLSFFFFFFSCTRITEQKGKCFGSIFFGNKRNKYFFTEIEPKLRFICSLIVTSFVSNILTRIYLKKNCSACDDYVRLITVTVEAAQA